MSVSKEMDSLGMCMSVSLGCPKRFWTCPSRWRTPDFRLFGISKEIEILDMSVSLEVSNEILDVSVSLEVSKESLDIPSVSLGISKET